MNHTNWESYPKFTIDCSKLTSPVQICSVFKHYNVDRYLYRISNLNSMVIKYGMSSPNSDSRIPGERVYRQVAHCYSWGAQRIDGSSGADWLIIERDFKQQFGVDINHKYLKITVWDFTNFPFRSFDDHKELRAYEATLIKNHIEAVGYKPIGNINDEANHRKNIFVSKDTWESLFNEDPESLLE